MIWASTYAVLYSLGGLGRLSSGWTFEHWRSALSGSQVVLSLGYSLANAAISTAVVTAGSLGVLLAFPTIRSSQLFLSKIAILMATPVLVLAQMVSQVLAPGGWISRIGHHFGCVDSASEFPVLVNDRLGIGMLLAIAASLFPLSFLYFSQLWNTVRADRMCELAMSLGASTACSRLQVALPALMYRGWSIILLVFILALGSYEIPLLLGQQSPQMFSVMTQRLMFGFDLGSKPQAYALATLYLITTSCVLVFYVVRKKAQTHG